MTKSNKELISGILLFLPIYIIIFSLLTIFKMGGSYFYYLFPVLLYLPIIIGLIMLYKYKKKINKIFMILIIVFCLSALYFYYLTYFGSQPSWKNISEYYLWGINTGLARIVSFILYGKSIDWKKSGILFGTYMVVMIVSAILGFWN